MPSAAVRGSRHSLGCHRYSAKCSPPQRPARCPTTADFQLTPLHADPRHRPMEYLRLAGLAPLQPSAELRSSLAGSNLYLHPRKRRRHCRVLLDCSPLDKSTLGGLKKPPRLGALESLQPQGFLKQPPSAAH